MNEIVIEEDHMDETQEFQEEEVVIEPSCLFRPNDMFKSRWDFIIMLFAVFNCYTIPVKVAFNPESMNTQAF